jgi:hypothetical protein
MQAFRAGLKGGNPIYPAHKPRVAASTSLRAWKRCLVCKARDNDNGSNPRWAQQQQQQRQQQQTPADGSATPTSSDASADADDPLEAMLYVAQQEMGMGVVWADPEEEEEELEDMLDELEDVWMRNPAREFSICVCT